LYKQEKEQESVKTLMRGGQGSCGTEDSLAKFRVPGGRVADATFTFDEIAKLMKDDELSNFFSMIS